MGTYYIPRNYKGETRLLYIFSIKSLITTALGAIIGFVFYLICTMLGLKLLGIIILGLLFYFIFSAIGLKIVGVVILAIFAVIGYAVGAFKIPTIVGLPVTKKIGGESISDIIIRYVKFKRNRKIYTYVNTINTDVETSTKEEE